MRQSADFVAFATRGNALKLLLRLYPEWVMLLKSHVAVLRLHLYGVTVNKRSIVALLLPSLTIVPFTLEYATEKPYAVGSVFSVGVSV